MSYKKYLSKIKRNQPIKSRSCSSRLGFIALIFISFFLFFTTSIYANNTTALCEARILHSKIAKAVAIDPTQRPITGWQEVNAFPHTIESYWKNYSGSVWYKIQWDYQCTDPHQSPMTLVISNINMAGQIYINDDLLWQDQSLVEPLSRSWNMPRYWSLPASSLKQGENIIWIRVVGVISQGSGLGEFFIGTADDVMPKYLTFWNQQRTLMFFNLIFSLTLGTISFLIWLFHRKDSAFGWFTLASLSWSLVITNAVILYAPFGLTTLQIARISIICFLSYAIFSCFYAWRLAQRYFPHIEKFFFIFLFSAIIAVILIPDTVLGLFVNITFIISALILLLNFLSYPFIAYQSKLLEAYIMAFTFIFFTIIAFHDLLFIFNIVSGFLWLPYTAPLTALLIAIILAIRLTQNIKEIKNFNKTLATKVQQAQDELAISMNSQYQLELENMKLQERMNLAHDLHDGLGGSLVRSMAMINQSKENLSNPQFLSMLKLLRDDLRQIIDTGSSAGATLPETPILWAAPVRHRFIQIFDEMNIQSSWSLPATWLSRPSPLECLTLLRVIEESLTNIIKHSQATVVNIRLYYPQPTQLVLDIEDNGIGFDVDSVLKSGISVGIRSMQIRLTKIQADMDIQSQAGKTSIIVTKEFLYHDPIKN